MTLKEARFKKGFTQFDLRLKTGIHQSKISLLERNYMVPREDEKARLAKALGVRSEEIKW